MLAAPEDTVSEFSGVRAPVLCHCFCFSPTNSCETILSSLQTHFHLHFTLFIYSPHSTPPNQHDDSMIGKEQQEENVSYICLPPIQTIKNNKKEPKDALISHTVDFQWPTLTTH